jgi:hypothetical protein
MHNPKSNRLSFIAVTIVHALRLALMTLTGSAVFTTILVAAFAAERQQARQDIVMQEMRGPIGGGRS